MPPPATITRFDGRLGVSACAAGPSPAAAVRPATRPPARTPPAAFKTSRRLKPSPTGEGGFARPESWGMGLSSSGTGGLYVGGGWGLKGQTPDATDREQALLRSRRS